jgi:hypothetical protein
MSRANRYALAPGMDGGALEPWVRALHGCNNVGRRAVLREAERQGVGHNAKALKESRSWRTSSALMATLPTVEEGARKCILDDLTKTEGRFIDKMTEFYDQAMRSWDV